MAQRTVLQLFNRLMQKTGQSTVTDLGGMSGLQLESYWLLQEAVYELYAEDRWQFSEADGTINMQAATKYATCPNDLRDIAELSFFNRKTDKGVKFVSPDRWDKMWRDAGREWRESGSGDIGTITAWGRKFRLNKKPTTNASGSLIDYRYWVKGTTLGTTATAYNATINAFPPEAEEALLSLAAKKVMQRRGSPESVTHHLDYYGGRSPTGERQDGHLQRLQRMYRSKTEADEGKLDMDYQFGE